MKLKKVLATLLIVATIVLLNSKSIAYTYTNYKTYEITTDLYVRDANGEILRVLKEGEKVVASDEDSNGKRKIKDKNEYISAKYTKAVSESTSTTWKNYKQYTISITTGYLNIRNGPGTEYNVVGKYEKGTIVKASDAVKGWRKIENKDYYISAEYTKAVPTTSTDYTKYIGTEYAAFCVKVSDSLNVRSGAGTKYPVVGSCRNGQIIFAKKLSNGWSRIYGQKRYVNSSYLVATTWAEIDISEQLVVLHKKNGTKYYSLCVTGNVSAGNGTPTGLYRIGSKSYSPRFTGEILSGKSKYIKDKILLMGDAEVGYWMPFYRGETYMGIGFHDASWRYNESGPHFGGTIYKTNGSHGCINLPKPAAKQLFLNLNVNSTVFIHK